VISFIVNSVNKFLKNNFDRKLGFADDTVSILDPAVGTGTFLWLAYLITLGELKNSGLGGLIDSKIENHILKRFYGFEIQITPYIFSHLKLASVLSRWHYSFKAKDRVQV
jgi:predicted helicase